MIRVSVDLGNEDLKKLLEYLEYFTGKRGDGGAFPNTYTAFQVATRTIQKAWQGWAMGGELDGAEPIKTPSTSLMQSIKVDKMGDFSASIYTDHPYMAQVQNGQTAYEYDMKNERYYAGRKSRVSKEGVPYVIIPFRWGTENDKGGKRAHFSNMVEKTVSELLLKRKAYKAIGSHFEPNAKGEMIERNTYAKGSGTIRNGENTHAITMTDGEGNEKSVLSGWDIGMKRLAKGVGYFTFRIISAKTTTGWVRKMKAIPANDVVGALEKKYEPEVSKIIEEGFKADIGRK